MLEWRGLYRTLFRVARHSGTRALSCAFRTMQKMLACYKNQLRKQATNRVSEKDGEADRSGRSLHHCRRASCTSDVWSGRFLTKQAETI